MIDKTKMGRKVPKQVSQKQNSDEHVWCRSKIIDEYSNVDANWVPDLVGRAWGNRGNARSRQGKLEAALRDYTTAIEICPWSVDPLLNRGAVLEQLGRCAFSCST
jgi:tetratricopeptide (TPR) repeat protein